MSATTKKNGHTRAKKSDVSQLLPKYQLTEADKQYLKSLEPLMEGMARSFGNHCEIVLHSLDDLAHSVIHIKNRHITGRDVGAPITNLALNVLAQAVKNNQDVVGPYQSKIPNGRIIKSVTSLLRNQKGDPIGFLCINIDMNVSLVDFIRSFQFIAEEANTAPPTNEIFPLELSDLIHRTLADELAAVSIRTGISATEKNRLLTKALEEKHIFGIKGAVEIVAREMGISRHTIYGYLRDIRRSYSHE
jgi:predicted transcriptional regulator YheO